MQFLIQTLEFFLRQGIQQGNRGVHIHKKPRGLREGEQALEQLQFLCVLLDGIGDFFMCSSILSGRTECRNHRSLSDAVHGLRAIQNKNHIPVQIFPLCREGPGHRQNGGRRISLHRPVGQTGKNAVGIVVSCDNQGFLRGLGGLQNGHNRSILHLAEPLGEVDGHILPAVLQNPAIRIGTEEIDGQGREHRIAAQEELEIRSDAFRSCDNNPFQAKLGIAFPRQVISLRRAVNFHHPD